MDFHLADGEIRKQGDRYFYTIKKLRHNVKIIVFVIYVKRVILTI